MSDRARELLEQAQARARGMTLYVVDNPDGERLQGVKGMFDWEVEYFTSLGYKFTKYEAS